MSNKIFDESARAWVKAGRWLGRRPAQFIGILVGALILMALAFSSFDNNNQISEIQRVFCNSNAAVYDDLQKKNCRKLLDQLLKSPTPEQTRRIRKIVTEE